MRRIGGIIEFKIDGAQYSAKGSFTYNLGKNKREGVVGSDSVHGYKEMPQIPYIEGIITDNIDLDLPTFLGFEDATVTLSLANGKVAVFREAWNASEGNVTTEEGEIEFRIEAMRAEEVR